MPPTGGGYHPREAEGRRDANGNASGPIPLARATPPGPHVMTAINLDVTASGRRGGGMTRPRAWHRACRALTTSAIAAAFAFAVALPGSVGAQAQGGVPAPAVLPRFTNSKASLAPGATMVITWRNLPRPSGSDMAALYPVGATIDEFITWVYLATCRQGLAVPGINWATASCTVHVPDPSLAGNYEWRLLRTLAVHQRHEMYRFPAFTVTAAVKANGKPYDTAVTTKSAAVVGGDLLHVAWKDVADPTIGDWIGVFEADDDSNLLPLAAQPTSCNLDVPRALEAGTCPLGIPFDAVPGTYEVRLFTIIDGLDHVLATSEPVEVGAPPPDATPPRPMVTFRATPTPIAPPEPPAAP